MKTSNREFLSTYAEEHGFYLWMNAVKNATAYFAKRQADNLAEALA